MKTYSRVAILIVCLFTIAAGTGSNPPQLQRADHPTFVADGSGPIQTCRPGTNCGGDDNIQIADGSGPIQTCRPGTNCGGDDTLRAATPTVSTLRSYTAV